jgi:putative transposase
MDGKGRLLDTIFVEQLLRSLKYECVYLQASELKSAANAYVRRWIGSSTKSAHSPPLVDILHT